jgi:hypothetical protein
MRQEMVVIGNEWNFGCCAERREFTIVRIFNEDKVVGIDTADKLSLWPKEISELIPTEGRNSAQNKLSGEIARSREVRPGDSAHYGRPGGRTAGTAAPG